MSSVTTDAVNYERHKTQLETTRCQRPHKERERERDRETERQRHWWSAKIEDCVDFLYFHQVENSTKGWPKSE
jgi:hypothetical protein